MSVFMIVDLSYHSLDWSEAYRREVPAMVAKWGGRYVAQSFRPEQIEGDGPIPDSLAILEFPSAQAAHGLMSDPDYVPHAEARRAETRSTIWLVETKA